MTFQRRNLRETVKKRDRQKFLKEFPEKAQKRFEKIAEKMKEISSPFSSTPVQKSKKSGEKKIQEKSPDTNRDLKNIYNEYPKKTTQTFVLALIFLLIFWGGVGVSAQKFLENFSQKELFSEAVEVVTQTFGSDLDHDAFGRTNILLLGSGGPDHEGGFLTDSIIVVSLNHKTNSLSMLSIPRDLYVSYTVNRNKRKGKINALFRDGYNYWKFRSNTSSEIFAQSSVLIRHKVEEIIGGDIHYSAFIDFDGFVDIVDELGGVPIDVEKSIYDTSYPGPNYSYRTFSLDAGLQTLSGDTALKYVRSRHGNAGGDFGRSHRQKKMIMALKEKAFSEGIFSNPEKLQDFFSILEKHFWTDLSPAEILSTVHFVQDISKDEIISVGITDTVEQGIGGFLYTPPRDDIEHRMSVFLPYLAFETVPYAQVHYFWETISLYPSLSNNFLKIEVLNGTSRTGLASKTAQNLLRYSIKTSLVDDLEEKQEESRVEYISSPENKKIADFLERKLNIKFEPLSKKEAEKRYPSGESQELKPLTENTFRIILGKDFNTNAYTGSLIRTPLSPEKQSQ